MDRTGILLIDLGNSAGKWLLLDAGGAERRGVLHGPPLAEQLAGCAKDVSALCASVASAAVEEALAAELKALGVAVWFARTPAALGGLKNAYREPEKLGVDRWLAMLAAHQLSSTGVCVVDAGSALTIDFVTADGQHTGGFIIPGQRLMERALVSDTAKVRFDSIAEPGLSPGCSTAEAVAHGILLAQCGAIELALRQAPFDADDAVTYICGGGAGAIAPRLSVRAVRRPDLVFEGLLYQAQFEGLITAQQAVDLWPTVERQAFQRNSPKDD